MKVHIVSYCMMWEGCHVHKVFLSKEEATKFCTENNSQEPPGNGYDCEEYEVESGLERDLKMLRDALLDFGVPGDEVPPHLVKWWLENSYGKNSHDTPLREIP